MQKTIGEKISELRKARALTQEKLGERLGVSSQAVSKWENGENLPDILTLPKLCEVLGLSIDALLEMPLSAKRGNALEALAVYAREAQAAGVQAAFEAVRACSNATLDQEDRGSAQFSADGLRVCTKNGIALVVSGKEAMQAVFSADFSTVSRLAALLSDETVLKLLRVLSFSKGKSEEELAADAGVDAEAVGPVLFRLMKLGFVECVPAEFDPADDDPADCFLFGVHSYALMAVLAGLFLAAPDGYRVVNGVSRFFSPEQE